MNAQIEKLKIAAGFLRQAQALSEGAREFFADDTEHTGRLNKIAAALHEERISIEHLVAAWAVSNVETGSKKNNIQSSRIEELNAELLECERLNNQLDELTATFDAASGDSQSSEDVILKSNADQAEKRLLDKIETLSNCLSLERPGNPREILIFALRAQAPVKELIMAISEDHTFERKQGCIAYRLLQGIISALEQLAAVTRQELGFDEPQTEAEIIEQLKAALAHKTLPC